MKCRSCGATIIFKKKYCPSCGAKLDDEGKTFDSDEITATGRLDSFDIPDEGDDYAGDDEIANGYERYTQAHEEKPAHAEAHSLGDQADAEAAPEIVSEDEALEKKADTIKLKIGIYGGGAVVIIALIVLVCFAIFGGGRATHKPVSPTVSSSSEIEMTDDNPKKTEALQAILNIQESYFSGKIDYETAKKELYAYYDNSDVTSYCKEALDKIFEENDYRTMTEKADELYAQGDFEGAIPIYAAILEKRPDDDNAKSGYDRSVAEYRTKLFSDTDELVSDDKYDDAIALLTAALEKLPDDKQIEEKISDTENKKQMYLHKLEMQKIVEDARAQIQKGNWDDAYEYILENLKKYPNDEILTEYKKKVRSEMPITLYNIDLKDSNDIYRSKHHIEDKAGKDYKNYVRFNATKSASATFILDGNYRWFRSSLFVDPGATSGKDIVVVIEVDGEFLESRHISEKYSTMPLEVYVSGAKQMKITAVNTGTAEKGYVIFAGTSFERK